MTNDQLQSAIEKASGAYPGPAQELAAAIRAEIVRLMDERDDNAYLAAVAPQPEPPAPPAFAVGTRVRAVGGTEEGTVVFVSDTHVTLKWDDHAYTSSFRIDTKFLEPLPSEPAQDAPALPAGVTRFTGDEKRALKKAAIWLQSFIRLAGVIPTKHFSEEMHFNLKADSETMMSNLAELYAKIEDMESEANNG